MIIPRALFSVGAAGVLLSGCSGLTPGPRAAAPNRITIRAGRFVNARTGASFTPFGANY